MTVTLIGNSAGSAGENRIHPGSGRRKAHIYNKGRQLDPVAFEEVTSLFQHAPQRDMLIEYLHAIQDSFGCLHARHLRALAEWMRLSMAEIYEVATFYAHFTVLEDDEAPLPEITLRVCDSLTCALFGAEELLEDLSDRFGQDAGNTVRVLRAPCMGRCDVAPVVEVGHNHAVQATPDNIAAMLDAGETHAAAPGIITFDAYKAENGYRLLQAVRSGEVTYENLAGVIEQSGLRGLGGAGFPAAKKWGFVRAGPAPRLMCINGDEGEPGTFKDKYYLDKDPHRFLEGTLVAMEAVGAERCYIYMRDEYPALVDMLRAEVNRLQQEGIVAPGQLEVRRGAGAYICGEESALIESVEGKRGLPRHRPPYVAQNGVFGRPTLVHNVETVYWIREIFEKGADWFTSHGRNGRTGLRSFSVSGHVRQPGVKLAPAGITLTELIDEYCGGMLEGHRLKAYLPGGASGGILPASLADVPLDFDTLQAHDCFIGSAAIVVLSDRTDMRGVAINLMKFFEDESCGQCTPCRNGTSMAVRLMQEDHWDAEILQDLSQVMMDASICGLGQAAPNPLLSVLKHFPEEVLAP
uniref:NAD(P)H-dependent oxidoreductase subunit E n=1 Tax=Pararhizobium sp. IMCC3301 TaxID=3067904 RepID=UPI00274150E8|nr:NAD(P)H-dependent oxidoreductase subunit E [Pararhizobium sp. IMCC3301]